MTLWEYNLQAMRDRVTDCYREAASEPDPAIVQAWLDSAASAEANANQLAAKIAALEKSP